MSDENDWTTEIERLLRAELDATQDPLGRWRLLDALSCHLQRAVVGRDAAAHVEYLKADLESLDAYRNGHLACSDAHTQAVREGFRAIAAAIVEGAKILKGT